MHEYSLLKNLLDKVQQLSHAEGKPPVVINIELGALAHISASHLREHWEQAVIGTPLQVARLEIRELNDTDHPRAQDIVLESLEFAVDDEL